MLPKKRQATRNVPQREEFDAPQAGTERLREALAPFWSPYPQGMPQPGFLYPQPPPTERSRGIRRGPEKSVSRNNKTLMK